jgi:hypothetical protein
MSKFDLIFEKALLSIKEDRYFNSSFADNIRLLVKALIDSDLLGREVSIEDVVKSTLSQPKNVKEISLDTQEQSLPPIKLHLRQPSTDSEDFSITVIDMQNADQQKEFTNSMLETIITDALEYIRTIALQGLKPEAAVDTLPSSDGANAQPGGESSALPGVQEPKQSGNPTV